MKLEWTRQSDGTERAEHNGIRIQLYSPGAKRWFALVSGKHLRNDNGNLWYKCRLCRAKKGMEKWIEEDVHNAE